MALKAVLFTFLAVCVLLVITSIVLFAVAIWAGDSAAELGLTGTLALFVGGFGTPLALFCIDEFTD